MSTKDNGGPVHPRIDQIQEGDYGAKEVMSTPGMTLRQWYAGQAIQGLLVLGNGVATWDDIAVEAFRQADAMLEFERKERDAS